MKWPGLKVLAAIWFVTGGIVCADAMVTGQRAHVDLGVMFAGFGICFYYLAEIKDA